MKFWNFWNFDQILGKMKYFIFESFPTFILNFWIWISEFWNFWNFDQILKKMKYFIFESFRIFIFFEFLEFYEVFNCFWIFKIQILNLPAFEL